MTRWERGWSSFYLSVISDCSYYCWWTCEEYWVGYLL